MYVESSPSYGMPSIASIIAICSHVVDTTLSLKCEHLSSVHNTMLELNTRVCTHLPQCPSLNQWTILFQELNLFVQSLDNFVSGA